MAKPIRTVPQIIPEPFPNMLPEGYYPGKVIEFLAPKRSKLKEYLWYVCIKVEIVHEDETYHGFCFINGYPIAMIMIYRSRHVWLDKEFKIAVQIEQGVSDDLKYNRFELILEDGWANNG